MIQRVHKFTRARSRVGLICLAVVLSTTGCGGGSPEPEGEPEATAAEMESAGPRIFFVEPEAGATLHSPVRFVFGAENLTIEPVGDGDIHPGAGHHHLGVDTDCLPAGTVIPDGDPSWIHFGTGSTEIDMQLDTGSHRFCLQVGDGEHRTLAGLSEVINITVSID